MAILLQVGAALLGSHANYGGEVDSEDQSLHALIQGAPDTYSIKWTTLISWDGNFVG
jgi:hypothetical protein